jgi:hypothetical protein
MLLLDLHWQYPCVLLGCRLSVVFDPWKELFLVRDYFKQHVLGTSAAVLSYCLWKGWLKIWVIVNNVFVGSSSSHWTVWSRTLRLAVFLSLESFVHYNSLKPVWDIWHKVKVSQSTYIMHRNWFHMYQGSGELLEWVLIHLVNFTLPVDLWLYLVKQLLCKVWDEQEAVSP